MSDGTVRHRAAIVELRHSFATALTERKSPSDANGNPASITSTPKRSNWRASDIFSSRYIEQPGDCSPSRSVVSKIVMFLVDIFPREKKPGIDLPKILDRKKS